MRWAGKVGYARPEEVAPGRWEDVITEVSAFGELTQQNEAVSGEDAVLPQYRVTTSVSIITDGKRVPSAGIRYFTMYGEAYELASLVRQPPRMVLYPGEVYRGPRPSPTP